MLMFGPYRDDAETLLQDRSFVQEMKADILRRAEEAALADEDEDLDGFGDNAGSKGKTKGLDVAFEEELDDAAEGDTVKVRDGDESELDGPDGASASDGEDDDDEDGEAGSAQKQSPETILELAYLRDAKLFERDGQTRRSKARAALREQTGWTDEQIEGWKIMLERNVRLLVPLSVPACILLTIGYYHSSLTKTRFSRSMSSRETSPFRLLPPVSRTAATIAVGVVGAVAEAVVVEAAAGEAVVEVVMAEAVEEDRAMQREIGHGKTRIRQVERTTTGRGDMTRRWRGLLVLAEASRHTWLLYLPAYSVQARYTQPSRQFRPAIH